MQVWPTLAGDSSAPECPMLPVHQGCALMRPDPRGLDIFKLKKIACIQIYDLFYKPNQNRFYSSRNFILPLSESISCAASLLIPKSDIS